MYDFSRNSLVKVHLTTTLSRKECIEKDNEVYDKLYVIPTEHPRFKEYVIAYDKHYKNLSNILEEYENDEFLLGVKLEPFYVNEFGKILNRECIHCGWLLCYWFK